MQIFDTLKEAYDFAKTLPCMVAGLLSSENELISKKGFVADKSIKSVVTLTGKKAEQDFSELCINVWTGGKTATISPKVNAGTKPCINLFSFDTSGTQLIFFSIETSQESCYSAVFSVNGEQSKTVFDSEKFVSELSFELLLKSKLNCLNNAVSPQQDIPSQTNKGRSAQHTKQAKQPSQSILRPAIAVFPYFNPFVGSFSLQLWQNTNTKFDNIDAKIFTNLRYINGTFSVAFQGIVQH